MQFLKRFDDTRVAFSAPVDQEWFEVSGVRFFYKHATGRPTRVWQWQGLSRLRKFSGENRAGRVVLEGESRFGLEGRVFLLHARDLMAQINQLGGRRHARNSFSAPMESGEDKHVTQIAKFVWAGLTSQRELAEIFKGAPDSP